MTGERRILDSWKEIGAYLDKTEKTCRAWERHYGLPIHRLIGSPKARVFAYADELDAWKAQAGRIPFAGDPPLAGDITRETETPRDPTERIPLVSENRGRSFLERIALPVGAVVLLALLVYAGIIFLGARKETPDSIAVLPFENIGRNPDLDIYCSGIPDFVREKLSQVPGRLKVISSPSSDRYKNITVDPVKVGRELDVESLLTGTVALSTDSLSIRAELVRTSDGSIIIDRKYERKTGEIFYLEDVVFASVAEGLGIKPLGQEGRKDPARPIDNVAAYEFYLKAKQLEMTFPAQAIKYLQSALDITGDNAFLYAAMALIGGLQNALFDVPHQEMYLAKAEEYANKALSIDPEFPPAHAVLGYLSSQLRGDQRGAVRHFKRALAGNPEDYEALGGLVAIYIEYLGRLEEAAPLVERLKAIDPQSWWSSWNPGGLEFFAGRYHRALDPWRRMLSIYPDSPTLFWYALALIYSHRSDEAFLLFDQNAREFPDSTFAKMGLLLKWALRKNKAEAASVLTPEFEKACKRDADWARLVAVAMALLAEKEKALDWLQNAVDRGFLNDRFLEMDPFLENLRGEERWKKIIDQARRELETIAD